MYDSLISTKSLIETVKAEADISLVIPDQNWLNWINAVEQTLYTEVIRELRAVTLTPTSSPIAMTDIVPLTDEGQPIFEDVIKFYGDRKEFQKATLISSITFSREKSIWYKDGSSIGYSADLNASANTVKLIYCVRPKLKAMTAVPDFPTTNIALPPEFIELMACKLRGEAYKLANEDNLSAKWLADYNGHIETFKLWIAKHNQVYGE